MNNLHRTAKAENYLNALQKACDEADPKSCFYDVMHEVAKHYNIDIRAQDPAKVFADELIMGDIENFIGEFERNPEDYDFLTDEAAADVRKVIEDDWITMPLWIGAQGVEYALDVLPEFGETEGYIQYTNY